MQELTAAQRKSPQPVMDEVGARADARGLTPAILDTLLGDEGRPGGAGYKRGRVRMPLHLYPDVHASGSISPGWVPIKDGTIKYPVRNQAVRRYLRQLLPGRWQKVIKKGNSGDVHYFEHASGQVAGVKYYPN